MIKFVAFAVAAGLCLSGTAAFADDSKEARLAAAKRLVADTEDVDNQMGELIGVLNVALQNPSITPEQRRDFVAYARDHIDRQQVTDALINARAEVYTVEEMNALSDLAESPVGKSIKAKSAQIDSASRVYIVPIAINFLKKYSAECTDPAKCISMSHMMPGKPSEGAAPAAAPAAAGK